MAIKMSAAPAARSEAPEFVTKETVGVISTDKKGRKLELRYGSWNGNVDKYDLRKWYVDEDGEEKCAKGVGLTGEELVKLLEILKEYAAES